LKIKLPRKPKAPTPVFAEPGTIEIPTADSPAGAGERNTVILEGQRLLDDAEMDDSDVELIPPIPRHRPARIVPQLKPSAITWLDRYRQYINDRVEPVDAPFTGVSETILRGLEDAEKTRGGPRGILAKVARLAQKTHLQIVSDLFKDKNTDQESEAEQQDGSGEEYSQDLLECIRRAMIVEARIRESSNTKSQAGKNQKKTALRTRTVSNIPPGGLLRTDSVPGESIPAMERLSIDQYSNATYWQFAPVLEPVGCGPRA
jgi:hypothetical protein